MTEGTILELKDVRSRRNEREREMLLIMVNAMRNLYASLYASSFISGTVMKDFNAVADILSDFSMLDVDQRRERDVSNSGQWT